MSRKKKEVTETKPKRQYNKKKETLTLPSKKALLIGINYSNTQFALRGCLNDIFDMESILKNNYGFTDISIQTEAKATKENILTSIKELVEKSVQGDILYIHYSGHGTQIPCCEEVDGLCECLVPYDANRGNLITDKELFAIFNKLPKGVSLTMCSDSCHSGNLTRDIRLSNNPNTYSIQGYRDRYVQFSASIDAKGDIDYIDRSVRAINEDDTLGNMAFLSGCRSDQTSADAYIQGRYNGAFTYSLVQLLKMNPNTKYTGLITSINEVVKALGFEQRPQLECSPIYKELEFLSQAGE